MNSHNSNTSNIKDITISNNRKKHIMAAIKDPDVLIQDDNGDLVLNTQAYGQLKESTGTSPIEDLLHLDDLAPLADYIVFQ